MPYRLSPKNSAVLVPMIKSKKAVNSLCWETVDSFYASDARMIDPIMNHLRSRYPHIQWRNVRSEYETGPVINLQVLIKDEIEAKEIYTSLDIGAIVGFLLDEEDYYVIGAVKNIIDRMLRHPTITARQIVGLGNALYAIERLPEITSEVECRFGINYGAGDDHFRELVYFDFEITDEWFQVSHGGSVTESHGGDSYTLPGWYIQTGSYSYNRSELYDLEDTVLEYLNLGASIVVEDNSRIGEYK